MLPIAAPSMPCEANRPLASHSERNRNQTRGMAYPALRRQRVLLREQSAAWEVAGNFSGGGCTIRTHGRRLATGGFQNRCNKPLCQSSSWMRRKDLNPRPSAYEADELPDCSTAQFWRERTDSNRRPSYRAVPCCHGKTCFTGTL